MSGAGQVFTIGHSNHDLERFISLLTMHGVEVVADVRSSPWSRFAPQFNREALERSLQARGVRYVFLGEALGGRPRGDEFYDEEGHVLYGVVAETPWFREGLDSLEEVARRSRVAMMCSEENPADCHRRLLVTRVLSERGVRVEHIRGNGQVVSEADLAVEVDPQQELFPEEAPWRSTRSVSPRRPRATSSAG